MRDLDSGGFALFASSTSAALQPVCGEGGVPRMDSSVRCLFSVALPGYKAPSTRSEGSSCHSSRQSGYLPERVCLPLKQCSSIMHGTISTKLGTACSLPAIKAAAWEPESVIRFHGRLVTTAPPYEIRMSCFMSRDESGKDLGENPASRRNQNTSISLQMDA